MSQTTDLEKKLAQRTMIFCAYLGCKTVTRLQSNPKAFVQTGSVNLNGLSRLIHNDEYLLALKSLSSIEDTEDEKILIEYADQLDMIDTIADDDTLNEAMFNIATVVNKLRGLGYDVDKLIEKGFAIDITKV